MTKVKIVLLFLFIIPGNTFASDCTQNLECRKHSMFYKDGIDYNVGCAKVKLKSYTATSQKVVLSENDHDHCYCTVHTSRAYGPVKYVDKVIPPYAVKMKDHYYAFPYKPGDKKMLDKDGNLCTPDGNEYGGADFGALDFGAPDFGAMDFN